MQPETMNTELWDQVKDALPWLWATVGLVILFAGTMLLANAIVPSFVETGDLPQRAARLRPLILGVAAVALVAAVYAGVMTASRLDVISSIYDRVWI